MAKKGGGGKKDAKKGKAGKAEKGGKGKKGKKGKAASKGSSNGPTVAELPPVVIEAQAPVVQQTPCRDDPCCESLLCRPNHYPGLLPEPRSMAVVGSECGSYESLIKLFRAGFRCADRVLSLTPWGNYVIFRVDDGPTKEVYFVFDGCTCNVNRFRYLDLNLGTAGLLFFKDTHGVITYIIDSQKMHMEVKKIKKSVIDDICKEFCEYGARC